MEPAAWGAQKFRPATRVSDILSTAAARNSLIRLSRAGAKYLSGDSAMNHEDILKFSTDFTIIKRHGTKKWLVRNNAGGPEREFTAATRNELIKNPRFKSVSVLVEARPTGELILLKCAPAQDYLRGLMAGAEICAAVKAHAAPVGGFARVYWKNCLGALATELNIQTKLKYGAGRTVRRGEVFSLAKQLNSYNPAAVSKNLWTFKLSQVRAFAPRIGIIEETPRTSGIYKCFYLEDKKAVLGHANQAGAISFLAQDKCPLVLRHLGAGDYQIVYSDLDKNYLRGLYAAQLICEGVHKSPEVCGAPATELFETRLLASINQTRVRLGQTKLKKSVLFPAAARRPRRAKFDHTA